ncbi:M23 family metallopeptidase [Luteibaculum oceani]|uniref:M23 family metallopeptidase n=1 Tax=Luteibaculum oceani TaxID=1294296 RepID=A0A5C6VJV0_9FLAO|nr:M23 family metallopeptidase [Luteibaculum oceani]TXC85280.1 M23 family metallopeptidase [Luteibaculum oceani]
MVNDKEKEKKQLIKKLRNRYRLSIIKDSTFEERMSFRLTPMNVLVAFVSSFLFLGFAFISIVVFTPLREFIPGYTDTEVRQQAMQNALLVDSLHRELKVKSRYVDNLVSILNGNPNIDSVKYDSETGEAFKNLDFENSKKDSLFRLEFETSDQYSLGASLKSKTGEVKYFFPPVKGIITAEFEPENNHYAVDVVAAENEMVKSVLDGTVISATWTSDGGYVISVQHNDNLISVYKHNSVLLKKAGDKVKAGESIAIIGNSGELTSGPHLHFELWKEGAPINPKEYIIFN